MEKLYGIEALKADMPAVFELMAELRREIDRVTGTTKLKIQEMRERGASRETLDEIGHRGKLSVEPMRREVEHLTRESVKALAFYPMPPVVVTADQINPPPALSDPARHRRPA